MALALGMLGTGMSLAMSPATESIMGSLPKAKAGIGSAMNDVVREVGGTLGVAVLGSVLASGYGGSMDGEAVAGLPADAAEAASDSVGGAHEVAAQMGGEAAGRLIHLADQAFVDAMTTTALLAAGVALVGALIAAAFLPSRAAVSAPARSRSRQPPSRERRQILQPVGPTAVLVPEHGKERLIEGEVASPSVARVDEVGVRGVEPCLHWHQVGHKARRSTSDSFGSGAMEGERVVERAAARASRPRAPARSPRPRAPALSSGASQSSGAWKLPRSGGAFGQRCEPRMYSIVPPWAKVSSSATQQVIISGGER